MFFASHASCPVALFQRHGTIHSCFLLACLLAAGEAGHQHGSHSFASVVCGISTPGCTVYAYCLAAAAAHGAGSFACAAVACATASKRLFAAVESWTLLLAVHHCQHIYLSVMHVTAGGREPGLRLTVLNETSVAELAPAGMWRIQPASRATATRRTELR